MTWTSPTPRGLWALCAAAAVSLAPAAFAADVTVRAADGTSLHAVHQGTGTTAVIFLHDAKGSQVDWGTFPDQLVADGMQVVRLDLRGHGASTLPAPIDAAGWAAHAGDALTVVDWVRTKGATRVVLVGARHGANVALNAGAAAPDKVQTAVLISPVFNSEGVNIAAVDTWGDRPLLVATSSNDSSGTKAAAVLEQRAPEVTWKNVAGGEVGASLLARDADLETVVTAWVAGTWDLTTDSTGQRAVNASVNATAVETTGVKVSDK